MGEDVSLDALASFSATTLIGKFMFCSISKGEFHLSIKNKMGIFLGYVPIWHLMQKGWICLEFKSTFDLETMLAQPWLFGSSNLVLRRRHPRFNPHTKPFTLEHNWVLLPRFPIEF